LWCLNPLICLKSKIKLKFFNIYLIEIITYIKVRHKRYNLLNIFLTQHQTHQNATVDRRNHTTSPKSWRVYSSSQQRNKKNNSWPRLPYGEIDAVANNR